MVHNDVFVHFEFDSSFGVSLCAGNSDGTNAVWYSGFSIQPPHATTANEHMQNHMITP